MLELALDVVTGTPPRRAATSRPGRERRRAIEGEGEVWLQIDGDPMRLRLPIEIALAPERLKILLPTPRA